MSRSKQETIDILLEEKLVAVVRTPDEHGVMNKVGLRSLRSARASIGSGVSALGVL